MNTKAKKTTDLVFYESDEMIENAKGVLLSSTISNEQVLKQNLEIYEGLIVNGISDIPTHKAVKEGIKVLKKLRTSIESKRKELTEPALKYQKALIEEAERLTNIIAPIEQHLIKENQRIEDAKQIAEKELFTNRSNELIELGYQLANGFYVCGPFQVGADQLSKLDDDQYQFYVLEGKKEVERKKQAEAESLRISQELEKTRKELEEKEKELNEKLLKIKEKEDELEAQKNALQQTYTNIEGSEKTPAIETPAAAPAIEPAPEPNANTPASPLSQITNDERASEYFQTRAKKMLSLGFSAKPQVFEFHGPDKKVYTYRELYDMHEIHYTNVVNKYHTLQVQKNQTTQPQQENQSIIPDPIVNDFENGFNKFRTLLIELANNTEIPLSRKSLIEWAQNLKSE